MKMSVGGTTWTFEARLGSGSGRLLQPWARSSLSFDTWQEAALAGRKFQAASAEAGFDAEIKLTSPDGGDQDPRITTPM